MRPFKAKPVNPKVLHGKPKPVKSNTYELTIPMSPAITKPKPAPLPEPLPCKIIKARPVPDLNENPFEPVIPHRSIPLPEFELPGDIITRKKIENIEKKRKQEQESLEKARTFKARPLPESIDIPCVLYILHYLNSNEN